MRNFELDSAINSSSGTHILKNSSGCVVEIQSNPKGELIGYKILKFPEKCTFRAPNLLQ